MFYVTGKCFLELFGSNPETAVSAEQRKDLNEINRAVCIYHVGQCCVSILWSVQQPIASGVSFFLRFNACCVEL